MRLRKKLRALIKEERDYLERDRSWQISIFVPEEAGADFHERLFEAVADLAYEQEDAQDGRGWDLLVMSSMEHACVPVHLLERALGDDQ